MPASSDIRSPKQPEYCIQGALMILILATLLAVVGASTPDVEYLHLPNDINSHATPWRLSTWRLTSEAILYERGST